MAPLKSVNKQTSVGSLPFGGIKTRSSQGAIVGKRKADGSPLNKTVKRKIIPEIGDKENLVENKNLLKNHESGLLKHKSIKTSNISLVKTKLLKPQNGKTVKIVETQTKKSVEVKVKTVEEVKPKPVGLSLKNTNLEHSSAIPVAQGRVPKTVVKSLLKDEPLPSVLKSKTTSKPQSKEKSLIKQTVRSKPVTRQSVGKSSDLENTLYVSALEDIFQRRLVIVNSLTDSEKKANKVEHKKDERKPPSGVEDFDLAKSDDPFNISTYAFDIFEYLKSRESFFHIPDYMSKQYITKKMRAVLIDWLANIQENFELNHETLYLAVKLLDTFLSKVILQKSKFQLLGCGCMLIACKYDERIPPSIEDFLELSDNLFTEDDLIKMQIKILKVIDFNLGFPLSYRFLRRYARCAHIDFPTLSLARYILELSLMEYSVVSLSDSKLACAALYLALQMKKLGPWTPTLEYYSGYVLNDFKQIVVILNEMLHRNIAPGLKSIKNKYSHQIFYEVALIPPVEDLHFSPNTQNNKS